MKLLLIVLLGFFAISQSNEDYDNVLKELVTNFNTLEFEKNYDLFADNFKKQFTKEQLINVFQGMANGYGQMVGVNYIKDKGKIKLYQIQFQAAKLSLEILLNADSKIEYFMAKPSTKSSAPVLERNKSDFQLPFSGEWYVVWGGDTPEENYHVKTESQKGAFDLVMKGDDGKTHSGNGSQNSDHYAYGKDILSPVNGEVVVVIDGVPDNNPGEMNPFMAVGNCVIIKTEKNEFAVLAHLIPGSITVKKGDKVTSGNVLGKCGNSGNSSEPHLHFHIQNQENMGLAIGAKTYFKSITVNGENKEDYSPVQGDVIKN